MPYGKQIILDTANSVKYFNKLKNFFSNQNKVSPAKVGDAALSLIYKPFQTEKWKRESNIVTENLDNLSSIYLDRFPGTMNWIDSKRVSLKVYGLETGVVPVVRLRENDQRTIVEILGNEIKWENLDKFSHVVIIIDCCLHFPMLVDGDLVTTYRLTPHAKKVISASNWGEYD